MCLASTHKCIWHAISKWSVAKFICTCTSGQLQSWKPRNLISVVTILAQKCKSQHIVYMYFLACVTHHSQCWPWYTSVTLEVLLQSVISTVGMLYSRREGGWLEGERWGLTEKPLFAAVCIKAACTCTCTYPHITQRLFSYIGYKST